MSDHFILTPLFIDAPLPGLLHAAQPGWEILDPSLPPGATLARLSHFYPQLAQRVADVVRRGDRPVSLAGDCCTAIPVLAGLQQAGTDPLLVWFDAHGDFNTWETTPSGFLGGMPLAMLVGRGEQTLCKAVGLRRQPETQVILAGARDLDPGEREAVAGSGMVHLQSVEQLADLPLPDRPIWVHFDTDVLRPEDAPAMNYLAPGGPSAAALGQIFDRLAAAGNVCAVSISAWNPELDSGHETEAVVMRLVDRLLARAG